MVSASDTDTDFTVGKTGGEKTHTHKYGLVYANYYGIQYLQGTTGTDDDWTGIINYKGHGDSSTWIENHLLVQDVSPLPNLKDPTGSIGTLQTTRWKTEGYTTAAGMNPYVSVYIWRRTA